MTGATLRRRDDGAMELRVNGVFVMDDAETSSEQALARAVLDAGARNVLVGGLGLGFTLRELLSSADVTKVTVVELHREIVDWMRIGAIPGADLLADRRTTVVIDDVRDAVASAPPSSVDAIVLDVDNGPDFLVHDANADLYRADFVSACAERLTPGGTLCIWSMSESTELIASLRSVFAHVSERAVPVRLQGREESYCILTATSPR